MRELRPADGAPCELTLNFPQSKKIRLSYGEIIGRRGLNLSVARMTPSRPTLGELFDSDDLCSPVAGCRLASIMSSHAERVIAFVGSFQLMRLHRLTPPPTPDRICPLILPVLYAIIKNSSAF